MCFIAATFLLSRRARTTTGLSYTRQDGCQHFRARAETSLSRSAVNGSGYKHNEFPQHRHDIRTSRRIMAAHHSAACSSYGPRNPTRERARQSSRRAICHRSNRFSGSASIIPCENEHESFLWEPAFAARPRQVGLGAPVTCVSLEPRNCLCLSLRSRARIPGRKRKK